MSLKQVVQQFGHHAKKVVRLQSSLQTRVLLQARLASTLCNGGFQNKCIQPCHNIGDAHARQNSIQAAASPKVEDLQDSPTLKHLSCNDKQVICVNFIYIFQCVFYKVSTFGQTSQKLILFAMYAQKYSSYTK